MRWYNKIPITCFLILVDFSVLCMHNVKYVPLSSYWHFIVTKQEISTSHALVSACLTWNVLIFIMSIVEKVTHLWVSYTELLQKTIRHKGWYVKSKEEDGFQGARQIETLNPDRQVKGSRSWWNKMSLLTGSLHTSKHGTLAGSVLSPSALLCSLSPQSGTTKCSILTMTSQSLRSDHHHGTTLQCCSVCNWPSHKHVNMFTTQGQLN